MYYMAFADGSKMNSKITSHKRKTTKSLFYRFWIFYITIWSDTFIIYDMD